MAEKINCYLCGEEAIEFNNFDFSLEIAVDCPKCKKYRLGHKILHFCFDKEKMELMTPEEPKRTLSKEQKEALSKYIKNLYKKKTKDEFVLLDFENYEKLTKV